MPCGVGENRIDALAAVRYICAPMVETYRNTVQYAALAQALKFAGGPEGLAAKLQVPAGFIETLLKGAEPIPQWVFLKIVDYINEQLENG